MSHFPRMMGNKGGELILEAQWIIENHQNHCAKLKFLKHQITVFQNIDQIIDRNRLIESLSLGRRVLDGMPHDNNLANHTENAVINFEDVVEREKEDIGQQVEQWRREVEYLEYLNGMYEVLLSMMNNEERLIVQMRYERGMSMEMIASQPLGINEGQYRSESTIRRIIKRVFNRLDHIMAIQICA